MSLVPISQLLTHAQSEGYALGYFESWNFESLAGVIDAAEKTRSPIIIGFNGDFLSRGDRLAAERLEWFGALGRIAAERASVPCGLIFNECPRDEWVKDACGLGFNLVMLADPEAPAAEYIKRVRAVVEHAHPLGVAVEAELGELPCGASGMVLAHHTQPTDPDAAASFVAETGVDLLAVSVGNVHIMVDGEQALDLPRLEAIRRRIPQVPLVLHGGTGIDSESLQAAISLGVAKVNYGTYLKQWYLEAVSQRLGDKELNPHDLLGLGGERDILVAGRLAVRDAVLDRIDRLGCCGRAWS